MKQLLLNIERGKMAVCRSVANWSLNGDLRGAAVWPVKLPPNPFATDTDFLEVRLDATLLRELFEREIWTQLLKGRIQESLRRAKGELEGKDISVVLLSGGSSNIRWLRALLERDLQEHLGQADILELSENFQEIVSKGLAIECARRFYGEAEGDFGAVTYNPLCLALRPDGGDLEARRCKPRAPLAEEERADGVLLKSASLVRGLIEKPIRWKTSLS
jgi:hypothetical protein